MTAAPALIGLSLEELYHLVTFAALPGWILLLAAPSAGITRILAHSIIPALLFGVVFALLIARGAFPALPPDTLLSLSGLLAHFGTAEGALAAWTYYLVFGLFVGAWETRDAARRGVPHWAVIPGLLCTMILGPLGLFLHILVRTAFGRGGLALD